MNKSDRLLIPISVGVFFIFFNGYMMAPILSSIAKELNVTTEYIGWILPAYLMTYGFSTLVYGPLSDVWGRRRLLLGVLTLAIAATALCAFAWSANSLIVFRIVCGVCAGGFLPISLAMIGDLYPFDKVGRAMGWIFGAVAGGSSMGSTVGAWLNPSLGWRNELLFLAVGNAAVLAALWMAREQIVESKTARLPITQIVANYRTLITSQKGRSLYSLILLNGAFHSGVFSWLGYYLIQRYQLGDVAIGTALLGYGLPGMFLGPVFGKLADKFGRSLIIPIGFVVASLCALALIPHTPLWTTAIVITILSMGFDMTHPLMAGLVSTLDPKRRGQAMGLNAFMVFTGFGLGAMVFQLVLAAGGMQFALAGFATIQLILGLIAFAVFKKPRTSEEPQSGQASA